MVGLHSSEICAKLGLKANGHFDPLTRGANASIPPGLDQVNNTFITSPQCCFCSLTFSFLHIQDCNYVMLKG